LNNNEYVKVNCRLNGKYCGMCCYNTQMVLTIQDILEIVKHGYPREYFIDYKDGIPRLKNVNGHCVFLDSETNMCKIYEYRPLGCRLYPLIYDVDRRMITVDRYCPKWIEVDEKMIEKHSVKLLSLIREIGVI